MIVEAPKTRPRADRLCSAPASGGGEAAARTNRGRRFTQATGFPPIVYVQHLRIEEAKRRLERMDDPVDEISWSIGYEDPAFFRLLFKRIKSITAGAYRRKFHIPEIEAV